MKVGIDLDGVVANFNVSFIERVIKVTGRDLFPARPFDIPCWDYPQHYGYTEQDTIDVWTDVCKDPTFWKLLPPYATTKRDMHYLTNLAAAGHDIYFITSRPGTYAKAQTQHWLMQHGYLHIPTVLISSEKGLCCRALGLDFYIDDRWENCVDATQQSNAMIALFDRPWNNGLTHNAEGMGMIRVSRVEGFAGAV